MSREIAVIGAGPAGIMAALQAARLGASVRLYDSNDRVGRKLRLTGSGRCNITNQHVAAAKYTCAAPLFLERLLSRFGHEEFLAFLDEHCIPVFFTADGWCYPRSQSANAVAETLTVALQRANVDLRLGCRVIDLRREGDDFIVVSTAGSDRASRVVVAAGGAAFPRTGSRGEFYPILQRLGHSVVPLRPALAPIVADVRALHKLQGVRLDAGLKLLRRGTPLAQTAGNLIITQWGLNGPAAMDLSHLAGDAPDLTLEINWVFGSEEYLRGLIGKPQYKKWPARVLLQSVLPPKVPPVFLRMSGLSEDRILSDDEWQSVLTQLTAFPLRVTGTKGFNDAQCSTGGIAVTEVDADTMMSLQIPGLYFAGEVMDVVGPCGGYNLQFAFSSGAVAGMAAEQF